MPVLLLPALLEKSFDWTTEAAGLAFVMDLREKGFLAAYPSVLASLEQKGFRFEIIFLEADERTLLQRYSQTRRPHPLASGRTLRESIRAEALQLRGLRNAAARVIDTSNVTVHELKSLMFDIVRKSESGAPMRINIMSFGFKYGLPVEADLVVDVRFLPNPFFVAHLKDMDGEAGEIKDYVLSDARTTQFLSKYKDMLDFLFPLYQKEGKSYLTVAVGCTGGRHRSVVVAGVLCDHVRRCGLQVDLLHRDIRQEQPEH
jgi:UPF0042 nucleotide-binding protein